MVATEQAKVRWTEMGLPVSDERLFPFILGFAEGDEMARARWTQRFYSKEIAEVSVAQLNEFLAKSNADFRLTVTDGHRKVHHLGEPQEVKNG